MRNKNFIRKLKSFKNLVLSLIIGLTLATGITFAWNAVWHGTDWIQTGAVINAQNTAENFECLKSSIEALANGICNKKTKGLMKYNEQYGKIEICDGDEWRPRDIYGDGGLTPIGTGTIGKNSEKRLGDDWTFVSLKGTASSGDASYMGGDIVRIGNIIKATLVGATGGLSDIVVNSNYQCIWSNNSEYKLCVKYKGGNLYIKTGTIVSLGYAKFK